MIVDPAIEAYLHRIQPAPSKVLLAMERSGDERGFPIIGPLVGRLCAQLATAVGARNVFEMGSGFGYSTVWFAGAVGPTGRVVHTDGSAKLSLEAQAWLGKARLRSRVEFQVGDARDCLRAEKDPFDIVFIDIEKQQYPDAWEIARKRVRKGGLILTDNALWQGKVANTAVRDEATRAVREYTRLAMEDGNFLTTILPLRDGVAVSLRVT